MQLVQQMTGVTIVTCYAPTLCKTGLGMSEEKALLLGNLRRRGMSWLLLSLGYATDRVGRRKLLMSMAFGMGVVLVGEGH